MTDKPLTAKYIVIEGPIGVGKTSFVELAGKEFKYRPVFEHIEDNAFLPKFYKDMKTYAFQTQVFFLLNRFKQQEDLIQHDLFSKGIISDYMFEKDRIFAYLNLNEGELALYEKIYSILKLRIPKPDLVVYLQANTEKLIERIKIRGRQFEKSLSHEYLDKVNKAYNQYFLNYRETPLLIVNTNEIDFVHKSRDYNDILDAIKETKIGIKYFLPIS
jgi:deoxyadenosine/deoxycytidine kinase